MRKTSRDDDDRTRAVLCCSEKADRLFFDLGPIVYRRGGASHFFQTVQNKKTWVGCIVYKAVLSTRVPANAHLRRGSFACSSSKQSKHRRKAKQDDGTATTENENENENDKQKNQSPNHKRWLTSSNLRVLALTMPSPVRHFVINHGNNAHVTKLITTVAASLVVVHESC